MDTLSMDSLLRQRRRVFTVLLLIYSSLQKVLTESSYAAVLQTDQGNDEKYCMAYNSKFHALPTSAEESQWLTLADFTSVPKVPDRYMCYRQTKHQGVDNTTAVIILRGNCSLSDKALAVQDLGASAVIIVANDLIVPNATKSEEFNFINISVGVILEQDFYKIMGTNRTAVRVKLFAPIPQMADFSILVLAFIAISTLVLGSYWSGIVRYQISLHRKGLTTPGSGAWNVARKEDVGNVSLTALTVVLCVVVMVGVLLGLYYFYDYLVYAFIVLFGLSSGYALYDCIITLLLLAPPCLACRVPENRIPCFKSRPEIKSMVICLLCLGVGVWWIVERHRSYAWALQDVLGVALCIHLLKQIRLPSFKVCFILFLITFVYDVFFVFITPLFTKNGRSIMIDVATGGGSRSSEQSTVALSKENTVTMLPLLMISPRFGNSDVKVCGMQFSMLGFGDILIPGLLVSFCHGFDMLSRNCCKIYFISTSIAYVVGLMLTWLALILMKTGQPALLYIVPCLLTTTAVIGAIRGELSNLWAGTPAGAEMELPEIHLCDPGNPALSEDLDVTEGDSVKEFTPIIR